jgi:hypothetical protein
MLTSDLETDAGIRTHREALRRLLLKVESLLTRNNSVLEAMTSQPPTDASLRQLDRIQVELVESLRDYLDQNHAFMGYLREHVRKMEEANRRAAMSENRSRPARNEARIQELSEELTKELRLERIDSAIKELLDFLSDAEFFAANASTGRRRRLRSLQNAIDKALEK